MNNIFLQIFQYFLLINFIHPIYFPDIFQLFSQLIDLIPLLNVKIDGFQEIGLIDLFELRFRLFFLCSYPLDS